MRRAPHAPVPRGLLALVFLLAVGLYWATLCPTVYWDDSGELISAAYVLGISHPPGQPLYTMLGWVFTHLPGLPSPAYAMNFLSAVFGALTWTLVAGWLYDIQRHHGLEALPAAGVAVAAALTGAAGSIAWSQAVIAENTTLHTAFIAALVWSAWRLGTGRRLEDRELLPRMLAWAFLYGLSATNHPAGVFLFPAFAAWFLATQGPRLLRPHWVAGMLVGVAAGLLPCGYLYLASRANPPLDWGNPETWPNFLWVVSAQQYQGDALARPTLGQWLGGAGGLTLAIGREWTVLGAGVLLAGWARLARRDGALALWPLPVLAVFTYLSANPAYIGAYLVPAFVFLMPVLAAGLVAAWALARAHLHVRYPALAAAGLAVVLPGTVLAAHWRANDLHRDDLAKRYGEHVLGALPQHSILVTESANLHFVALYLTLCEHYREDVVVITANGLTRPGYLETLQARFPDVSWPERYALPPEFARANPSGELVAGTLNPPWVKAFLLATYERNAARRRAFWEDVTAYGPILDDFTQGDYVYELRRPPATAAAPAWGGTPAGPRAGHAELPPPWDIRALDTPGGRITYANAVAVVGNARRLSGNDWGAVTAYAVATALNGDLAPIYTNMAVALGRVGRPEESARAFRRALALRPTSGMYAANLAYFYLGTGDNAAALPYVRRAIAHWPQPPDDLLLAAAQLELTIGEPERAVDLLERSAARDDHNLATVHNLATLYLRLGHPEKAQWAVKQALLLAPDRAAVWFNAAWLAADSHEPESEVRRLLAQAFARDPVATQREAQGHPELARLAAALAGAQDQAPRADEMRQPASP